LNPLLFTEPAFIFGFAPIVLTLYYLVPARWRSGFLLLASLFLYTWAEGKNVAVLLACAIVTYACGRWIEQGGTPRRAVAIGVAANVTLLATFKYAAFAAGTIAALLKIAGISLATIPGWRPPTGLSFFTFIAIAYLIDVYRKEAGAEHNPLRLTLFITLFPQLVAGPITRFANVDNQLNCPSVSPPEIAAGIRRFVIGFSKKIMIANTVAPVADRIFSAPANNVSLPLAWLGALCYTLQIYFDFSGYSDMAIGLAAMLGIRFPENFNYPYIANSVTEFWQRWHISLSTWLRDYLFFSLGVRGGRWKLYRNTLLVFLICGFWHGAAWHFVLWGLYYGVLLVIERAGWARLLARMPSFMRHGYTLIAIMLGWVLFRAESTPAALAYIASMWGFGAAPFGAIALGSYVPKDVLLALIAGAIGSMPLRSLWPISTSGRGFAHAAEFAVLCALFVFSIAWLAAGTYSPFLYSRF
jgi:alginate O-acetyltransferase complex protein AlgI